MYAERERHREAVTEGVELCGQVMPSRVLFMWAHMLVKGGVHLPTWLIDWLLRLAGGGGEWECGASGGRAVGRPTGRSKRTERLRYPFNAYVMRRGPADTGLRIAIGAILDAGAETHWSDCSGEGQQLTAILSDLFLQ